MDPERLKRFLALLSSPAGEALSDYERINEFCKHVPKLLEYVEELEEKAFMYDGLCD
jgi:hypothetical protein